LDEAKQRVENNHAEDDPRIDPQAQHQFGEAGAEEDINQDVVQLDEKPHERAPLLAFRQAVWAILPEPSGGFGRIEPLLAVSSEPLQNFVGRYRVPRRRTAVRVRVRCYAHACAPLGQFLTKRGLALMPVE
jgi:hypothetical protein